MLICSLPQDVVEFAAVGRERRPKMSRRRIWRRNFFLLESLVQILVVIYVYTVLVAPSFQGSKSVGIAFVILADVVVTAVVVKNWP